LYSISFGHTGDHYRKIDFHQFVLLFQIGVSHQFGQIAELQIGVIEHLYQGGLDIPSEHIELAVGQVNYVILMEQIESGSVSVPVGEAKSIGLKVIRKLGPVSRHCAGNRYAGRAGPGMQSDSDFGADTEGSGGTLFASQDSSGAGPGPSPRTSGGSGEMSVVIPLGSTIRAEHVSPFSHD
jgi:hypothetical protein